MLEIRKIFPSFISNLSAINFVDQLMMDRESVRRHQQQLQASQCCQMWRDHAKVAFLDPPVASKNLKWREPAKVEKCGVF